jgi:hypothetical protein
MSGFAPLLDTMRDAKASARPDQFIQVRKADVLVNALIALARATLAERAARARLSVITDLRPIDPDALVREIDLAAQAVGNAIAVKSQSESQLIRLMREMSGNDRHPFWT